MSSQEPGAPIRAVVYGVGEMGTLVARLLLDKGVEIVGAVARSPAKVGRDLGFVAGLGREIGVPITDDADSLLRTVDAHIALVAVASGLAPMAPHFEVCLSNGVSVLTLEEETFYPWGTAPALARKLDALGRAHDATLAASGLQDVCWSLAVSSFMATMHRLDRVRGRSTWLPDEYGPEVAEHTFVGWKPEAAVEAAEDSGWGLVGRTTLEALAAVAGLRPSGFDVKIVPIVAESDVASERLGRTIARGEVLGMAEVVHLETAEGIELEFEMAGYIHAPGETAVNEWWFEGEPDLHVRSANFPGRMLTCTSLVNRIPDVLAAPPGLVTVDRLPPPRYRPGAFTALGTRRRPPGRRR